MGERKSQIPIMGVGASAVESRRWKDSSKACMLNRGWHRGVHASESRARERLTKSSPATPTTFGCAVKRRTRSGRMCLRLPPMRVMGFPRGAAGEQVRHYKSRAQNPSISFSARWRRTKSSCSGSNSSHPPPPPLPVGMREGTMVDQGRSRKRGGLTMARHQRGGGGAIMGRATRTCPIAPLATGFVEFAIRPKKGWTSSRNSPQACDARRVASESKQQRMKAGMEDARSESMAILRNQVGHDFGGYKTRRF